MSKKILKRSLALGALMAFVITGSAFAETVTYNVDTTLEGIETKTAEGFDVFLDGCKLGVTYDADGKGIEAWRAPITIEGEEGSSVEVNASTYGLFSHYNQSIELDAATVDIKSGTQNTVHAQAPITINGNTINLSKTVASSSNIIMTENTGASAKANIEITGGTLTVDGINAGRTIRVAYGNKVLIDVNEIRLTDSDNNGDITEDIKVSHTGSELSIKADKGFIKSNIYSANSGGVGSISLELGNEVALTGVVKTDEGATNVLILNGATWNLTGESTLTNATFNAGSTLVIDGDKYVYDSKEDAVNTYALNGVGDKATLTVENGAKLKINGITETTYNIAKGFTNLEGAVDKWEVSDINALMQGVAWTTKDGLQVEVFAKKAEQMATDTGMSTSTAGLVQSIIENADNAKTPAEKAAVEFIEKVQANNSAPEAVGNAINNATKMGEAGGNSATAASIVKNVTGVTNDRLSFNCGHSAPHKGGHGVGLFEEGSGADVWVEYVHGKDEVEDMPSTAGASSYEGQYNGIVMGVDFKKVNKFQSGIAFNYGEGDTNSVGNAVRTHSDYDFWGVGYYGSIHNDDSNVIFDISYAQTDSDVTQNNSGTAFEANPETTTWSAGVKLEKLYQNENVQIVPYTGLRYMSIDADDYSTRNGEFYYSMDRQDIWLLPLGVSIRQEIANDNGWTVSPRVDLSYIWAFGDTNSNMEVKSPFAGVSQLGYDVMDDGSFLGLVGIEAHKGQWGYGVAYSYQKGDHSESKKWYVDVNYSF